LISAVVSVLATAFASVTVCQTSITQIRTHPLHKPIPKNNVQKGLGYAF
jgi:hypothetical protein